MSCELNYGPKYDLRSERRASRPKVKTRRGKPVVRDPKDVTGITLHQTGAWYGIADYQVAAAHGDRELALARRSLNVASHAMSFEDGFFVANAPILWHVNHANDMNPFTLGLEVEGLYEGIWEPTATGTPTFATIQAGQNALRWLVEEGRREGCPIEYIYAHRQSNKNRRADPGEALWWFLVEMYAIPVLGLKVDYEATWEDGRPVPYDWSKHLTDDLTRIEY